MRRLLLCSAIGLAATGCGLTASPPAPPPVTTACSATLTGTTVRVAGTAALPDGTPVVAEVDAPGYRLLYVPGTVAGSRFELAATLSPPVPSPLTVVVGVQTGPVLCSVPVS